MPDNRRPIAPLAFVSIGIAVLLIVGASAIKQRREAQPWLKDPPVHAQANPWDAISKVEQKNPLDALPDVVPEAAERARQEREEREARRKQRAVYECVLRNGNRMNGYRQMLWSMCHEFPDLR